MDLRRIGVENLALALFGTSGTNNTTAIVGESGYKIVPGMFLPTKRLINTTVAPVVKKGATTILTADYSVSVGGITIHHRWRGLWRFRHHRLYPRGQRQRAGADDHLSGGFDRL